MFDFATEALRAFSRYPVVEAFLVLFMFAIGVMAMRKGERDRKNGTPVWTLYGPVHEAIGAIHEMNEQSRIANGLLSRLVASCTIIEKEQREQTQVMETIFNNQMLRTDPQPRRK